MTTQYVILEHAEDSDVGYFWKERAQLPASSAEVAIRLYVGENPTGGTFVAIPARSWNPVEVAVEQSVRVKIGSGGES